MVCRRKTRREVKKRKRKKNEEPSTKGMPDMVLLLPTLYPDIIRYFTYYLNLQYINIFSSTLTDYLRLCFFALKSKNDEPDPPIRIFIQIPHSLSHSDYFSHLKLFRCSIRYLRKDLDCCNSHSFYVVDVRKGPDFVFEIPILVDLEAVLIKFQCSLLMTS